MNIPEKHCGLTYETYRDFVCDLIRLQAWYAWWLYHRQNLVIDEILEQRVRFYRKKDQSWDVWKKECLEKLCMPGNHSNTASLEHWILEQDRPYIDKYLPDEFEKDMKQPILNSFWGISYEFHPEYEVEQSPDFLTLHFRNYFAPDSPFHHPGQLTEGLKLVIGKAVQERPDISMVQCATWLNNLPAFVDLFPPAYRESARLGPPGNHFGWWGQFMDRTGYLHQKNAEKFRQSGDFPYKHYKCKCSLKELQSYLYGK